MFNWHTATVDEWDKQAKQAMAIAAINSIPHSIAAMFVRVPKFPS